MVFATTEKFKLKSSSDVIVPPRRVSETEHRSRLIMEEMNAHFKKDDERYRALRKDLKSLEQNLKASKRFL